MEQDFIEKNIIEERNKILLQILVIFKEKILDESTTIKEGENLLKNDLAQDILFQWFSYRGYMNDVQMEYIINVIKGNEGNGNEKIS